jgi:hypothetical protein
MKHALMRINTELLRQVLKLPDGVTIAGADMTFEHTGELRLRLEGDCFANVPEGHALPYVQAEYQTVHHDCAETVFLRFRM